MSDPRFWEVVADGRNMRIDLDQSNLLLEIDDQGNEETFQFNLSPMQRRWMECGGAAKAFDRWGKGLWQALTVQPPSHGDGGLGHLDYSKTMVDDEDKAKLGW